MPTEPILLWFRQDLRLAENPALQAALASDRPIIPIYIWAPDEEGDWPPGGATKWWLHYSLDALTTALEARESRLIIQLGPTQATLDKLIEKTKAAGVMWNRRYEPAAIKRDTKIKSSLRERGLIAESFNSALLLEPSTVSTQAGGPFKVFTPFYNACRRGIRSSPLLSLPRQFPAPARWPASLALNDLKLLPKLDWAHGFPQFWAPGEAGALKRLKHFMQETTPDYPKTRDLPAEAGTSRLSPHLHFGEIGPHQVWRMLQDREEADPRHGFTRGSESYLRQICWREFAHHLLYHFPDTPTEPLRSEFARFPWRKSPRELKAWQRGLTGFPLVDAGMRELWQTGWMHNRVRMLVASFLIKDLLIPWQTGAKWFWDTLVDADLANNTLGWQWVAGCGADAAPYFRIFNPTIQSEKFDPEGLYIRQWVPELAHRDKKSIHEPFKKSRSNDFIEDTRSNYTEPILDHAEARERALEALASIK